MFIEPLANNLLWDHQPYIVYMGEARGAGISTSDEHHSLLLAATGEYESPSFYPKYNLFSITCFFFFLDRELTS